MLELMNKYPKINRFMWALLLTQVLWILLTTLPAVITAIVSWQQLGK